MCECFSIRGRCKEDYFIQCVNAYLAQFPDWITVSYHKNDARIRDISGEKCVIFTTKQGFGCNFVKEYSKTIFIIPANQDVYIKK